MKRNFWLKIIILCIFTFLLSLSGCMEKESSNMPVLLFDSFNDFDCSHTNSTNFTIDSTANITIITLWYHWSKYEPNIPYRIIKNNTTITSGTLLRNDCDPINSSWCNATTIINMTFQVGTYQLIVPTNQIGMNKQSNYEGFIKIYGIKK